jgi:hypothetical protein
VDIKDLNTDQLIKGMKVEKEHSGIKGSDTKVTRNDGDMST